METTTIPIGLLVLFVLACLVLTAAVLAIFYVPGKEYGKRMPSWVVPVSYTALMLLTPFVMLVVTMLLFPCWWREC